MMFPLVKQREGQNPWVSYFQQRVRAKNSSNNIVVVGPPGIGKSWATLSLLSQTDPTFDIERCLFKASTLLKMIKEKGPNRLKKGQAIFYDEAGIDLNSTEWQGEICKAMNLVWQTCRFRGLHTALVLPYTNFLSKGVRTLMTSKLKVLGWNSKTKLTKIKPLAVEFNPDVKEGGKFYHKRLLVKTLQGSTQFCNTIEVPAPEKSLRIEYEKLKQEYTDDLYDKIGKRVEEYERKSVAPINKVRLTENQREVLKLLKEKKTIPQIANEVGKAVPTIYTNVRSLQKKGVVMKAVKNSDNSIKHYEVISGGIE
jgi:DNA-binding CsgD family transcriptional regulator